MENINFSDFLEVDIGSGTILRVEEYKKAKKNVYILEIDFGPIGIKKSSAQITDHYRKEELIDQQIMAVVNFPPKQIGKFLSEVLVLGLFDENNKVVLVAPKSKVKNGSRLF